MSADTSEPMPRPAPGGSAAANDLASDLGAGVSVTGLCERIAQVLAAPEGSADDGRHLVDGVDELTPTELGYLHPFILVDTEAMRRRHDRRIDLVVALWRRRDDARYAVVDAVRTLDRLSEAARYDPFGPAATVATAVTILTRCRAPDTPEITRAAVRVLGAVYRVLGDRERAVLRPATRTGHGANGSAAHAPPWQDPLALATLAALPGADAAWPGVARRILETGSSRWDTSHRAMLTDRSWRELLRLRRAPELWIGMPVEPVVEVALGPDEVPGYRAWLRRLLEDALAHVRDMHEGRAEVPADGAFPDRDALLVARAALQASVWDEPWIGTMVSDLLPSVAAAPRGHGRGVLSSTLAIALGLAIARAPTPETVTALTQALEVARHPGTRKRLKRHLATAHHHLELGPARVLRDASDGELAAGDLTALARSLESGYLHGVTWPLDGWLRHVRAEPRRADLVARLVWRVIAPGGTSISFRGHPEPGGIDERWVDAYGQDVELLSGSTVALWHPLPAEVTDRDAWRDVVWDQRIEQPLPQAYREHYHPRPAEPGLLSDFAGRVVDLEPFLEAARAQGWSFDRLERRLVRQVGGIWARIGLSYRSYPGVKEANATGPIQLSEDRDGHEPWQPGNDRVQRIQVSELLRSVDLMLTSTEVGASDGPETPIVRDAATEAARTWADALAVRREVVSRATVDLAGARLGTSHLHVGDHAIHLRTGRVTRGGDEIVLDVEPAESSWVPWVPYDDRLLSRILAAAAQCSDLGR